MTLYNSALAPAIPKADDGTTVDAIGTDLDATAVDAIALSTSNTYTDAAVNTAVNAAITQINTALTLLAGYSTKIDALIEHLNNGRESPF